MGTELRRHRRHLQGEPLRRDAVDDPESLAELLAVADDLHAQLLERDAEIESVRSENEWRRRTEEVLQAEVEWRRRTEEVLQAEVDWRRGTEVALRAEVEWLQRVTAELEKQIDSITASRAWRWWRRYARLKQRVT